MHPATASPLQAMNTAPERYTDAAPLCVRGRTRTRACLLGRCLEAVNTAFQSSAAVVHADGVWESNTAADISAQPRVGRGAAEESHPASHLLQGVFVGVAASGSTAMVHVPSGASAPDGWRGHCLAVGLDWTTDETLLIHTAHTEASAPAPYIICAHFC